MSQYVYKNINDMSLNYIYKYKLNYFCGNLGL